MGKYKLRMIFDWGSSTVLWTGNDEAFKKNR